MAKHTSNVNVKKAYEKRYAVLQQVSADLEAIEKVHISMGNSKMGMVPSFSVLPLITCSNCSECSKHCYACAGNYNYNSNVLGLAENTALMMHDLGRVEKEIETFLNSKTVIFKYFRYNVAGDIFSIEYLDMIIRIAKNNPWTTFLAFTKNYDLLNDYLEANELPENVTIVFSKWGNTEIPNKHNLPVAIVKLNEDTAIPETAFHCSGDCANCLECWHAKKIQQDILIYTNKQWAPATHKPAIINHHKKRRIKKWEKEHI